MAGFLKPNAFLVLILGISILFSILAILKLIEPSISGRVGYAGSGGIFLNSPIKPLYDISPYLLPITWGGVIGTLVWKGKLRTVWKTQGYDYDTFKMIAKMRGSPTRIKLLNSLNVPKNKLQLAKELDLDWKAIDNHMKVLQKNNFVEEMVMIGTSKYYLISKKGKNILKLLSSSD
jgi:DNA-binding transcriptional ArsR family regulator